MTLFHARILPMKATNWTDLLGSVWVRISLANLNALAKHAMQTNKIYLSEKSKRAYSFCTSIPTRIVLGSIATEALPCNKHESFQCVHLAYILCRWTTAKFMADLIAMGLMHDIPLKTFAYLTTPFFYTCHSSIFSAVRKSIVYFVFKTFQQITTTWTIT